MAEFQRLLGSRVRLLSLDHARVVGELPEPHATYVDNARAKAEAARALAGGGVAALADDSGIEVLALGGWPGPESARWMGEEASDRDRLLGLIEAVRTRCPGDARVRYVAAVALAGVDGSPARVWEGTCSGVLVEPRGGAGFGYDPGFLSDDLGVTFGEASAEAKDGVSHRARAVQAMLASAALDAMSGGPRSSFN